MSTTSPISAESTAADTASARALAAARVKALAPGRLPALLMEAIRLGAVDLALGTPGTPTPPALIEAASAAMRDGRNQYEMPEGNVELRTRLAEALGAPTDPMSELTITVGASEALAVALLSTVDPGYEVIVFEPFYETFVSAIALAGGVPRFVSVRPPEWRWRRDELEAAFGPQTRAVLLNTPSNPTGHVLGHDELAEIAELCEKWNATVLSDEVYGGYVFDGNEHVSVAAVPELRDRSVVIGSLSKSHSASGWRLGYLRAEAELSKVLRQVHVALVAGTAAPLQEAAARAAAADPGFFAPSEDLTAQRERAVQVFEDFGMRCIAPEGGCYVMADISPITDEDGETFAHRLVQEAKVLVTPGNFFYSRPDGGAEFIRIAFNRRLEVFDEVERLLAERG
ncbi:MAG: pyridoxal phosphate-dependent aminotransferase [Gaiellaceae bacterium]